MINISVFSATALAAFSLFTFVGEYIDRYRERQTFRRALGRLLNSVN